MKFKKLTIVLCVVMCLSMFASLSASASTKDSVYTFETTVGWIYLTEDRAKEDASATYVYYIEGAGQTKGTYYSVWSEDENDTRNGSGIIYPGQKRLLAQYVYEKGKRTCCLGISPNVYNCTKIAGNWSPDSVGSYPYAN